MAVDKLLQVSENRSSDLNAEKPGNVNEIPVPNPQVPAEEPTLSSKKLNVTFSIQSNNHQHKQISNGHLRQLSNGHVRRSSNGHVRQLSGGNVRQLTNDNSLNKVLSFFFFNFFFL